jgi:hypothetical protein
MTLVVGVGRSAGPTSAGTPFPERDHVAREYRAIARTSTRRGTKTDTISQDQIQATATFPSIPAPRLAELFGTPSAQLLEATAAMQRKAFAPFQVRAVPRTRGFGSGEKGCMFPPLWLWS